MSTSPYSHDNVRRGVMHYLLGRGMSAVAGFLTIVLLVRHMEVTAYAAYAAALGLNMVAGMLAGLGMERALTRYIPEGVMGHAGPPLLRFIWSTTAVRLLVMLGIVLATYLVWPALTAGFEGLAATDGFPAGLAVLLVASSLFQLFSAILQALVQQRTLTRILVVQWGGRLLIILGLLQWSGTISLAQALWLMAVPDAIGVAILAVAMQRYLAQLPHEAKHGDVAPAAPNDAWPNWGEVTRLSLHNYGYNLLAALPQGSSMILLAAAFLAAPFVAAYGFFISVFERLKQYLPLQFLLNLAEPVLIAGYVKDRDFERLCHHNRLLYKFNLMILAPGLAWLCAAAPQLTAMLTGGKYAEFAWIFPLLLLQIMFGSHATIIQIIINAVGCSRVLSASGTSALIAMAAAIAVVLASGNPAWLVVTPLAYEIVNNAVAVIGLRRAGYRYQLHAGFHGKLLAATGMAWLSAKMAIVPIASPLAQTLVAGMVALSTFGAVAALLRIVQGADVETLKQLVRRGRQNREPR